MSPPRGGNSTAPSILMLEASDQGLIDRQQFERQLDEMVDDIHRYDLADLGAAAVVDQGKFEKAPLEDILQMTFPGRSEDERQGTGTGGSHRFPASLTVNDAVLGYINYFSNRGHRTLLAGLQRSGRYRPMIQRILDEEGCRRRSFTWRRPNRASSRARCRATPPAACGSSSSGAAMNMV